MYKKIKESKLPQYKQLQHVDFCWGSLSGEDFRQKLEVAYSEVVHWKRNLFQIPRGEVGGNSYLNWLVFSKDMLMHQI